MGGVRCSVRQGVMRVSGSIILRRGRVSINMLMVRHTKGNFPTIRGMGGAHICMKREKGTLGFGKTTASAERG